ncbi:hypothetical protein [Acinetobacter baumannii]|uniref:hypothetical protein n=1 Tax=Acinetobacter baumannii TaxID=470 RepID=UPI001E64D3DE|nr:hypothetical protein [Acinetobacter baumannii]
MSHQVTPAWILYDLLLSKRYGLGEYITPEMIDESRLYVIGQYCDQLVDDGFGTKNRDTQSTALSILALKRMTHCRYLLGI